MQKQYIAPVDMVTIATQHAYCADYLLKQNAEVMIDNQLSIDALLPICSLMYQAFELTFKAYLLHGHHSIKPYKTLFELIELNNELNFSHQDIQLINTLSRQLGFRKGIDYALWKNRQQQQAFCEQIIDLYERVQALMPLELQADYQ